MVQWVFRVPNFEGEKMAKVDYEWCCEEWTDDRSDVIENYFGQHVSECLKVSEDLQTFSIVLIRNVYCDVEGLLDRSYAYVNDGKLPGEFECGSRVPKRFTVELEKALG